MDVRGVTGGWKQSVGYFLSNGPVKAVNLKSLLLDCISKLKEAGMKVVVRACSALGMLEDSQHWYRAMAEMAVICFPRQRRRLFALIAIEGRATCDLRLLWRTYRAAMSEDVRRRLQRHGWRSSACRSHRELAAEHVPLLTPDQRAVFGEVSRRLATAPAREDSSFSRRQELNIISKGYMLFQQLLLDAFAKVKPDRLCYLRHNQDALRADTVRGLTDAIHAGDVQGAAVGRIVLPTSFTGGTR
ncbi:hypothetical protein FJT64_020368 [Amphibalanus amphitrite]|uniref:Transposable element P transposase-like RNase H domain-containing protein n=1 Tax=Amphibalanus amphitrite TaxID=1232801 RepID=A0A6A4WSX9_AMPAM|nr:hypothetical protein FJT64_020368 [Amphibalanus amphitrite]